METSRKLQSYTLHIHGEPTAAAAARTPSTFSTKNSASLSALMSVEADTGLCHMTRLMKMMKMTARHTIFG